MKIRFRKNAIRYRLSKTDVKNLKEHGFCEERTDLLPNGIIFSLNISKDNSKSIRMDTSRLGLQVPYALIAPVMEGTEVGFECGVPGSGDSILKVLVERDFKCLAPGGEQDADAFENPMKGKTAP